MDTPSLFDPPGEAEKQEAIDRVEAHAPAGWNAMALDAIIRTAPGTEFTTDDLWLVLPEPPEPRAMGAAIRRAAKQGLIVSTGRYRKSNRPECHRRPMAIWARRSRWG